MRVLSVALALTCFVSGAAMAEGDWRTAGRLDAPRSGLSTAVLEGTLYAAGGSGLTDPRNEFESYDVELDRWFQETPLPRGLERFGMAVIEDRIYIAGGYARGELGGVGPSPAMWSWSPASRVWQSEAAMPAPRADLSLVALSGKLYAIGGAFDDEALFVFDPESREWESLDAPAGIIRSGASALALGDEIIIAGGFEGDAPITRVDIFNAQSGEWREAASLPEGRAGAAIALDEDGRVHLFGGRGPGSVTLDTHVSWQPGEAAWRIEEDLPSPRTNAAAAFLEGAIFVVGGGSGGGFFAPFTALDTTDVYEPAGD